MGKVECRGSKGRLRLLLDGHCYERKQVIKCYQFRSINETEVMQHSSSRHLLLLSDSKSPIKRESTHLVTLIMGNALKGLKGTTIIAWQSQANSQRLSSGWHNLLDKAYSEASVTIARKRTLSSSRKSSLQNIEYTLDAFKWGICRGLGTGQEYQDCIAFHRLFWP